MEIRPLALGTIIPCPPGLARLVENEERHPSFRIVQKQTDEGVCKFAVALADGAVIESVIIPGWGRTTLCVSSQAGCRMGCTFCTTGATGFARNLAADEIVWQLYAARFILAQPIDNLVFMGMGEPLDNIGNVARAIRIFSDQRGFNVPQSRITLSTAGHAEGLAAFAAADLPLVNVAVSLNAANDTLRSSLMPINRRFPLDQLKAALKSYPRKRRGVILVEYVLLAGVNDTGKDAEEVIDYLQGLPVRVNLIGYNESFNSRYSASSPEAIQAFRDRLTEAGLFVRVRKSKGRGIMAACGQLGALVTGV